MQSTAAAIPTQGSSVTGNGVAEIDSLLVRAHSLAAFAALLLAVLFGIAVSLQFIVPDLLDSLPSWGRMRYAHTQGIMFGWLGNAFFAFMYYAVPILSGRAVSSRKLGVLLFALWNFAVMIPGWVLVLSGYSQPLEWAEFPLPVDALIVLALVMAALQFLPPFFRHGFENLYVSSWYLIGALVFTLLSYPMGNILPELIPGAAGAAFSGLWIHDAVGLFVTPMALAILYFVIPAATGRPIYSHFLSMLGFWGLFFLYPLNGIHHYIYSVIPMAAQLTAILASFLLGAVVVIVVSNLMLSQRGSGIIPQNIALRFASMSVVFYLVVSLQGSLQANMAFSRMVHFTDFIIGHSHLAMLGFATFAGIAGVVHAWQQLPEPRINLRVLDWAYWLLTIGIVVMVVDLTIAGLVQGGIWQGTAPWLDSIRESTPYWLVRTLSAIPIAMGFVLVLYGLLGGSTESGHLSVRVPAGPSAEIESIGFSPALRMSYIVAFGAGIGFFLLSVSLLGLLPLRTLNEQAVALAPAPAALHTPSEQRGRDIYAREGCAYCHTQQIRYTDADMRRFGAPSLAWEGRRDIPHMLGTRRIGPDLARTANTRTREWHLAHLFAPRSVVPRSIMPAYRSMFNGSPAAPRRDALDLLAYLESLGKERDLAWPEGDQRARELTDDLRALMSLNAAVLNAHPGMTRPRGSAPVLNGAGNESEGRRLWRQNCAGCHGDDGRGDGWASEWLQPAPKNLTEHRFRRDLLADILWNGVHGSSMPAWREFSVDQLSALAAVVDGFSAVNSTSVAVATGTGREIYQAHCAECHGDSGEGNGYAADSLPIPILPSDFTRELLSEQATLRVLREGVTGTSMAPWGDRLNPQEMIAVAGYVRSLFQDTPPGSSADD